MVRSGGGWLEIFCGIDWSEAAHDVAVVDETGRLLARRRIADDAAGFTALTELLAGYAGRPERVDVAIETGRGLLVAALRHGMAGAKSDPGDARVLADILRTDRDRHRPLPADSDLAAAVGVLARAHQDAVWARVQDANRLRSLLREFFPAALTAFADLTTNTALAVLAAAPTPTAAARLSRANLTDLLRVAGRGTRPTEAARLAEIFTVDQLRQPPVVEAAMGQAVRAIVRTLTAANQSISDLEAALAAAFDQHPDGEILRSLPGLGRSSPPGCSASSVTTRPASRILPAAGPTPAPPRSLARPAAAGSCWPATSATNAWPTPATCGPSPP